MIRCAKMWQELHSVNFWRAVLAEFVGMAMFLFVGLGATSTFKSPGNDDPVRIALCFGLAIATIVHCTAHISGGHVNPAVTIAFCVMHRITPLRTTMYIAAQIIGASVGTALFKVVSPSGVNSHLGPTALDESISPFQGLLIEILLTFQLVWTVFATVDSGRKDMKGSGPVAIGLAVILGHLSGECLGRMGIACMGYTIPLIIRYTGASMNPARSFGSAAIGGTWDDHWIYWVGPVIGGIVAAVMYDWVLDPKAKWDRVKKCGTCEYDQEEGGEENCETVLEVLPGNSVNNKDDVN